MKGHFVVNGEDAVAYIDEQRQPRIASFLYTPDMRMMTIVAEDGSEHTLDSEVIESDLHAALCARDEVLVVHLDKDLKLEREYTVPLTRN